jgi:hypothetical protein
MGADISNRTVRTPCFEGKRRPALPLDCQESARKVETARASLGKA